LIGGQQAYVSGNIDASVQQLQAAVDANPNDPRALNDLGQVLVRTGRAREAVAYLDKAVSLKPDSWAYQFNRARAYGQLQQWGQAVDGYQVAARLFPDDYATQYNLAKALQASGDLSSALPPMKRRSSWRQGSRISNSPTGWRWKRRIGGRTPRGATGVTSNWSQTRLRPKE
jgi:tetratricopeptide (TPR) repeat protein